MSITTVRSRADLDAEGDHLGAELRLGRRTGAWLAKRWSPRLAWGVIILIVVACGGFVPPVALTGFGRGISAVVVSDLVVFAVLLMMLPPRWRADRLYRYTGGIALQTAREAEPEVLRWADLESMTLTIGSTEDSGDYLAASKLQDRAGRALTVRRRFGAGTEEIIATAERVLAPGLVRELLGRYYAEGSATVGHLTVDQDGIMCAGISAVGPEWRIPWVEADGVEIRMHGQQVTVRLAGPSSKSATSKRPVSKSPVSKSLVSKSPVSKGTVMAGVPNGFAVRYLIEYAARQAGVAVTADPPAWDPETVHDVTTDDDVDTVHDTAATYDIDTVHDTAASHDADTVHDPADYHAEEDYLAGADTVAPALAGPLVRPARPTGPDAGGLGKYRAPILIAVAAVLAIEGSVIGYLFATRPYPPVVTAVPGIIAQASDGTASVVFTPDGRNMVFTDRDGDSIEMPASGGQSTDLNSDESDVDAVVSPDSKTMAALDGGQVDLFNVATRKLTGSLQPDTGGLGTDLVALDYSPDGRWLAAADGDGDIYLWNTATGAQRVLGGPGLVSGDVQAMAFSPDDTTIALGDNDGDITLWDAATGALRGTLTDPDQLAQFAGQTQPTGVLSLSFAGQGSLLAAADGNWNLYLWDTGSQSLVATFTGNDPVTATALNPAGNLVAGGTSGGETYLWDVPTQQQVAVLGGQSGGSAVSAVAFSPNGSQLAIGDKTAITIWSIAARSRLNLRPSGAHVSAISGMCA